VFRITKTSGIYPLRTIAMPVRIGRRNILRGLKHPTLPTAVARENSRSSVASSSKHVVAMRIRWRKHGDVSGATFVSLGTTRTYGTNR